MLLLLLGIRAARSRVLRCRVALRGAAAAAERTAFPNPISGHHGGSRCLLPVAAAGALARAALAPDGGCWIIAVGLAEKAKGIEGVDCHWRGRRRSSIRSGDGRGGAAGRCGRCSEGIKVEWIGHCITQYALMMDGTRRSWRMAEGEGRYWWRTMLSRRRPATARNSHGQHDRRDRCQLFWSAGLPSSPIMVVDTTMQQQYWQCRLLSLLLPGAENR